MEPGKSALQKEKPQRLSSKKVTLDAPLKEAEVEDRVEVLVTAESELEDVTPILPPTSAPPKSPSLTPVSPNGPTLQEEVDRLEAGLSRCVAEFRAQAEDLLVRHLAVLDEVQVIHDSQMSNLVAENTFLREKLGLKVPEQVTNIMFQNMIAEPNPKKRPSRGNRAFQDEEDAGPQSYKQKQDAMPSFPAFPPPPGKMQRGKKGAQKPGGSWQAFMAWVPNASAMQIAEPWKPLPPEEEKKGSKNRTVIKRPQGELAVLPGVTGEEKSPKEEGDTDSDSNEGNGGPEEFEMLDVWRASAKAMKKLKVNGMPSESESSAPWRGDEEDDYEEPASHGWILNPDSNTRIGWDLGSLIMVLYDMVMIPMQAYTLPENLFLDFMEWTTRLFWTFDIFFSCITGVVTADGSVEYDIKIILKRYAKTWLAMDLVIVLSDWSEVIFSSGGVAMLSFARTTRIIRIVRLLRLVRMQEIMANVTERIQSETLGPLLQVSKVLIVLLAVSHFTGCLWFAIGARDTTDSTWVQVLGYNTQGVDAQYLASLHWALSQFSGGMDEISPASPIERLFAVAVGGAIFVIALVMLGVFTSGLTQQYIIGGSGARQLATLKRYLKQNNVSKVITKRVCRNAKHAISGDLTPESVELLHVISEPLKIELSFDMYSQVLQTHHFFLELLQQLGPMMRPVCHRAMSMLLLSSTDVIFSLGDLPPEPKMYIVVSGTLEYTDSYGEVTMVGEKRCVSEASLWTTWKHRGTLTALSDAKLAMLDVQGFIDISQRFMRKSDAAGVKIVKYASQFVKDLNKSEEKNDLMK